MSERVPFAHVPKRLLSGLIELERSLEEGAIEAALRELVRTRVSQMNGCAYCVDMHSKEAAAAGVTREQLRALEGWRESSVFSARESAALAWAEALAEDPGSNTTDGLWSRTIAEFDDDAIVELTTLVGAIGVWNRVAIACGWKPGTYRVGMHGMLLAARRDAHGG